MSAEHGPSHAAPAETRGHEASHEASHSEPQFATFVHHEGITENFADKKIKWGASLALVAIGTIAMSHPVVGLSLLTYAAGDFMADMMAKFKNRSKKGMFPEHQGPFEQTMDKGVKRAGMGLTILGVLGAAHPVAGVGLMAYAAGDMAADFAAKVRRGNTPVLSKPGSGHH